MGKEEGKKEWLKRKGRRHGRKERIKRKAESVYRGGTDVRSKKKRRWEVREKEGRNQVRRTEGSLH